MLPSFGELAAQAGAGVKTAASNAATNLGTAAEAAPPVLLVTAGALGVKAAVEQYLHGQFDDKLLDVARHNRERVVETPLPPLEFPPAPPFAPPPSIDQTGKVKTITQTTSPLAPPTTTTQLQGKSSQPLPPMPPLINPLPDAKLQKIVADLNNLQMANGLHGIGTWTVTSESMSERAADYQEQITGVPAGAVYLVNGVKFDGFADGKLLDAKGEGYAKFINKNGEFQSWYRGANGLLEEARRQTTAAEGTPIVWHVAEEKAATAIQNLLKGKFDEITVFHTPKAASPNK